MFFFFIFKCHSIDKYPHIDLVIICLIGDFFSKSI
jgi:hypothetical protein